MRSNLLLLKFTKFTYTLSLLYTILMPQTGMNKTIHEQYLITLIINRLSDFLHILAYCE